MFPPAARAIVFDVVGTLVEPAPAVAEAYRAAALRHGIDHDVADIGGRFRTAWRRQEALDAVAFPPFGTSGVRERERWRAIVADVFDAAPQSDAIFGDLWAHFGRPAAWRPIPAGRDLVQAARNAGLTVALASNFDERLFGIATVIEPLSWADHVFASSELGWRKPAVDFFRTVEWRLGRSPTELVLVGDDPELDIAAGRRAGWHVLPIGQALTDGE
jgi:putative hydrolase of the HAD superfamily